MPSSRRGHRNHARRTARLVGIFASDVQVFRFYPDGTVLDVLVKPAPGPGDAELIAGWLRREEPVRGVNVARYEQQRARVSFTTRSHLRDEDVVVRGTWGNGRLVLAQVGPGWETAARTFVRLSDGRTPPPPPPLTPRSGSPSPE